MNLIHCEKEQLIIDFFDIGIISEKDLKINALEQHKVKLNLFLNKVDDSEIKNLINVVDALIIYMSEYDKDKAIKKVEHLWTIFNNQYTFSFYDIRILNCILFTCDTLENCVSHACNALNQLEKFNKHEKYLIVKTSLTCNLSYYLMETKYISEKNNVKLINNTLDKFLLQTIDNLIDLSMKTNSYLFSTALIKKGLLLKDKGLIYAGLTIKNDDKSKQKIELINKYDIFFITYKDLI